VLSLSHFACTIRAFVQLNARRAARILLVIAESLVYKLMLSFISTRHLLCWVFCIAVVGLMLQIFGHIMEKDREVYWEYANVTCAGYPLQHIDTISHSGEINTNSVMYKVVYGVGSLPMNRRNFILFKPINEENEARCA